MLLRESSIGARKLRSAKYFQIQYLREYACSLVEISPTCTTRVGPRGKSWNDRHQGAGRSSSETYWVPSYTGVSKVTHHPKFWRHLIPVSQSARSKGQFISVVCQVYLADSCSMCAPSLRITAARRVRHKSIAELMKSCDISAHAARIRASRSCKLRGAVAYTFSLM